jgi:hypothetical protein
LPCAFSRYRKSARNEPGKIVKHYGLADDEIPLHENRAFGVKKEKTADDNVSNQFRVERPVVAGGPSISLLRPFLSQLGFRNAALYIRTALIRS